MSEKWKIIGPVSPNGHEVKAICVSGHRNSGASVWLDLLVDGDHPEGETHDFFVGKTVTFDYTTEYCLIACGPVRVVSEED